LRRGTKVYVLIAEECISDTVAGFSLADVYTKPVFCKETVWNPLPTSNKKYKSLLINKLATIFIYRCGKQHYMILEPQEMSLSI
jgi:hypothetical protein